MIRLHILQATSLEQALSAYEPMKQLGWEVENTYYLRTANGTAVCALQLINTKGANYTLDTKEVPPIVDA